jgi:uridine phosphorylase
MNRFSSTELILNKDGSVYHLHLFANEVSDTIITVGDPERVELISKHLSKIRLKKKNREFYTITGTYKEKEISIISTGIGTDNIDIVFNELNILSKIDTSLQKYVELPRKFNIIRLGTSGTVQEDINLGSMLLTEYAIGLEGLINFYEIPYSENEIGLNNEVKSNIQLSFPYLSPYTVGASNNLLNVFKEDMILGITATCQGFYHPQGRFLWSDHNPSILTALRNINYKGRKVTNFEMETAGILGLARYFGHEACSISLILANRITNEFLNNTETKMEEMIEYSLEKILTI